MARLFAISVLFALVGFLGMSPTHGQDEKKDPEKKSGSIKTELPDDIQKLIKEVKGKDAKTRIIAIQDLGKLADKAPFEVLKLLCDTCFDKDPKIMHACLDSIQKIRPDLYREMAILFLSRTGNPRNDQTAMRGAINAIAKMKESAQAAETVLVGMINVGHNLKEPDLTTSVLYNRTIVHAAMAALREIQPQEVETFNYLSNITKVTINKVDHIRSDALKTLHHIANVTRTDPKVSEQMREKAYQVFRAAMVSETSNRNGIQAITYVGEYGPAAKDAIPVLKKLKVHKDTGVRDAANKALDLIDKGS